MRHDRCSLARFNNLNLDSRMSFEKCESVLIAYARAFFVAQARGQSPASPSSISALTVGT
jgi:hypothetical protein